MFDGSAAEPCGSSILSLVQDIIIDYEISASGTWVAQYIIDHYNDPECRKCFICLYAGAVASFVVSRMYMKENITIVAHRSKAA